MRVGASEECQSERGAVSEPEAAHLVYVQAFG
jgi:hypothetical protein